MRSLCLALPLALTSPVAAQDGWLDLRGQPVPEIVVEEWLNVDGKVSGVADLRGKVWLLEFFATW